MELSGKRAYELLQRLAYVRVSGTDAETKAAETLLAEARAIGARAEIETFPVPDGVVRLSKFEALAPYQKEYECAAYLRSDSTPEGGLEADFVYVENGYPANLQNAKGKIALTHGRVRRGVFESLKKAGVAAMVGYSGTTLDKESETDLEQPKLRETITDDLGFAVVMNVRAKDAMEMARKKLTRARLTVDSERVEKTSRNVVAVVPGTKYADEVIVLGGHYDSVTFSEGVYDNMSGSVILMELLRYFAENPPERTLKFCWYGSEEQGLLGSKAYAKAHEDEMDKVQCMINVDVAGSVLGSEEALVTGGEAFSAYVDGLMREAGLAVGVKRDIYSSDSIPFADKGVPCVNFARFGAGGAAYIHDRRDCMASDFLSADSLEGTARVVLTFAKRAANASVFPFAREMPDDMKEKIDKYLFRKK